MSMLNVSVLCTWLLASAHWVDLAGTCQQLGVSEAAMRRDQGGLPQPVPESDRRAQLVARHRAAIGTGETIGWVWSERSEAAAQIEAQINARATSQSRSSALAVAALSWEHIGRWDLAATAYELLSKEADLGQAEREQMLERWVSCLFPLSSEGYSVVLDPSGPVFVPIWKTGTVPSGTELNLAAELCSSNADGLSAAVRARLLLKLGWIERVRDRWVASNEAFAAAAEVGAGSTSGAEGLWQLAENHENSTNSLQASEALDHFAKQYPDDDRAGAALQRAFRLRLRR